MAETASFVLINGEVFIEEQELSQGADLPLTIQRSGFGVVESVCFNPVKFCDDSCYLLIKGGRHSATKVGL
jgi:hypothetical protein